MHGSCGRPSGGGDLDPSDPTLGAIDQKNFVFSMNLLGILEVGKAGDGAEKL